MRYTDFLKECVEREKPIIQKNIGYSRRLIHIMKESTQRIDYNCQFKGGVCFKYKDFNKTYAKNPRCCCKDCQTNFGYLAYIDIYDVKDYAKFWKNDVGFWRAGKGCILPRKLRSAICLCYMCNKDKIGMVGMELLDKIREDEYWLLGSFDISDVDRFSAVIKEKTKFTLDFRKFLSDRGLYIHFNKNGVYEKILNYFWEFLSIEVERNI